MAAATVSSSLRCLTPGIAPAGRKVHLAVVAFAASLLGCVGTVVDERRSPDENDPEGGENAPGAGPGSQGGSPPAGHSDPVRPGQPASGQRLTDKQLVNVVSDVFGIDLSPELEGLPLDPKIEGFRNAASALLPSDVRIEGYARLAALVASRVDWPARLAEEGLCSTFEPACERGFVERWGQRLFRRPLTEAQIERFLPLFAAVKEGGDGFFQAAALVIEALLQSPETLYRLEASPEDPDPFDRASRLSFLVWNAGPDDALLAAAAVDAQAGGGGRVAGSFSRLLTDERARRGLRDYVDDWLDADKLPRTGRDPERFPAFSGAVAGEMREEIHRLFARVVWDEEKPLAEVITTEATTITTGLAAIYGVPAPASTGVVDLPLGPVENRLGLLTTPGILTVTSVGGAGSSIVDRGVFVARNLLCSTIPEPPNNTPELSVAENGGSERERLEQHRSDAACAACHNLIDPLGLAFETFDAIGALMLEDEAGNPLTGAGTLIQEGQERPYANARAFAQLLGVDSQLSPCLARKLLQYGFARPLESGDAPVARGVLEAFERGGGTYPALLEAVAGLGLSVVPSP